MPAKLQFRRGVEEREIVCSPLLTIGRTPPNEIVIPHPKISRNHALIRMLGEGGYYLIDVGSTNGTFLNGKRVVVPTLLKDFDVIALEDATLTFTNAREYVDARASETGEDEPNTMTMTSMGVQVEEITLLVCDIRNYTPISESMPANELAALMANWFKMATGVIEACSGTID
jgi:adenylate cyclase